MSKQIEAAMTRYYLHIRQGNERIEDHEGHDFPDVEAALSDAQAAAREIMADDLKRGRRDETRVFEISDESGKVVATLDFRDVFDDG